MATSAELLTDLERDGYVVVKSVLDEQLVAEARKDLEQLYAIDLKERSLRNADEPLFTHGTVKSVLTPPSHLVLGLPGRSKALDQCFEKIFTDPVTSALLRGMAGDYIKIRDVNCRYMSGTRDEGDFLNPPHEWHRDSPGEFCIAIYLNDVPEGDNAATAVVPGSHRFPWCPRWSAMFGDPFYVDRKGRRGINFLTRLNPFNRLLYKRHMSNHTGAPGKAGDFYIFLNDTWHGRVPNLHGGRAMIVMAGGFPTDFPFPDSPDAVPAERLAKVPPKYRQAVARDAPVNTQKNTIVHRMLADRKPDGPGDLFWWARKEREAVAGLSRMLTSGPIQSVRQVVRRASARLIPARH